MLHFIHVNHIILVTLAYITIILNFDFPYFGWVSDFLSNDWNGQV